VIVRSGREAFVEEVQLMGQVMPPMLSASMDFCTSANMWSVEFLCSVLDPHVMSEK